jgi:aspartate-semialdehyde dehydrogenase
VREVNIAIVGATGAVGEAVLEILEQRKFPIENLYPLASTRSAGQTLMFNNHALLVTDLAEFDFSQVQIALFSAGGSVSAQYAPIAAAAGCVVIDNTSHFRYDADIPLVITEVNPEAIAQFTQRNIIANPNCSTIQMLVALKPIYDAVGISRINVATYQSVSGSGKKAIMELLKQIGDLLNGKPPEVHIYPQQIAFNVIPHIDQFQDNGYTKEEMKMFWETQKIFQDNEIKVNATCVRVPVIYGHSEAITIETREKITATAAAELLKKAPGVIVVDEPQNDKYPTPMKYATGKDEVFVGRIREDIANPLGLNLWVVSDNIRKGAALNAVQIAEILVRDYL